jgi:serine/threonine-protein kinase
VTGSADIDVGVRPGDVLVGKYRVERVLGSGGMGVVVAAHHLQLDEKVALKFLRPEALENAEHVARFDREARAAVKIKSEHVARVIDVGKLESGAPYIVMEYLEGGDLSAMLEKSGPLRFDQAVDFVLQACEAIAQAHALGIVHRDLKPSNLFCIQRPDGQLSIKVLDFGISKTTSTSASGSGSRDMGMTRTTAIIGSPIYMSPEQMKSSKGVDSRTDIWSLGVILYELVTGRVPFEADTVTELAIRVATEPTPPMVSLRADVPPGLERAILRCLEKTRERRYQNVAEVASALVEFGSKRAGPSLERIQGTLAPGLARTEMSSLPGVSPGASTVASWQTTGGTGRTGKAVFAIAGVAGVALLVVAGVVFVRRGLPAPAASAASAVPAAPLSVAAPVATPDVPASTPAPASASAAPAASHAAPAVRPQQTPAAQRPAAATPPAATKVHCDPPYYFDAQGNRVFKRECL